MLTVLLRSSQLPEYSFARLLPQLGPQALNRLSGRGLSPGKQQLLRRAQKAYGKKG